MNEAEQNLVLNIGNYYQLMQFFLIIPYSNVSSKRNSSPIKGTAYPTKSTANNDIRRLPFELKALSKGVNWYAFQGAAFNQQRISRDISLLSSVACWRRIWRI